MHALFQYDRFQTRTTFSRSSAPALAGALNGTCGLDDWLPPFTYTLGHARTYISHFGQLTSLARGVARGGERILDVVRGRRLASGDNEPSGRGRARSLDHDLGQGVPPESRAKDALA